MAPPSASMSKRTQRSKRTWSKEQLLRHLEAFSGFSEHIIPNLPPSPPASRSSSPAPGTKRKLDSTFTHEHPKRPRTSAVSNRPAHPVQPVPSSASSSNLKSSAVPATTSRPEPREEGEVGEDLPLPPPPPFTAPSTAIALADGSADVVSSTMPIRRPKQGRPSVRHFDHIHDRYYNAGRQLKYSGDARFWSTFASSHREYRALLNPPPLNSPYYKYGGLIARLELVDALICFTYALWAKDYSRRSCIVDSWTTTTAFLAWCKTKWQAGEASTDGEKALLGLIFMIEGFIHARKLAYSHKLLDGHLNAAIETARNDVLASITQSEQQLANPSVSGAKKQGTPQMLPSPASIAPTNSANSTPTNRDGDTPNPIASSAPNPPVQPAPGPPPHTRMIPTRYQGKPIPAHVATAVNSVTVPITTHVVGSLKDHMSGMASATNAFNSAQQTLTLPIIQRHFPKTFARMMHSTLSVTDEHEPDFEDDEGELFWPGQSVNGEGLGWVCLLGQAMLREFGQPYGYKGLAGVVPKPKPETSSESVSRSVSGHEAWTGSVTHGSTPSRHTPSNVR